jgi:O-antigen/teichoic acid export membrane protein
MTDRSKGYQRRTAGLVILSSLTTAITLFAVFRLTAEWLSAEWIGVWSLIQGLFLIARLSDSGAGTNISRVIAVEFKQGAALDLRNYTLASLTLASVPSLGLALATAPVIGLYVVSHFHTELSHSGLQGLVWLGLLNAVLTSVSTVLFAICEGLFQLNFKSGAVITANFAGLVTMAPVIDLAGPTGIGWTYVIISATLLLLSAFRVSQLMRKQAPVSLSRIGHHIRALWRENLHLTGIALIRLSFEPATKFLLSLSTSLTVIAQFELALRVTTQIRVLIQSGLQPLVALGARGRDTVAVEMHRTFVRNDRLLFQLSIASLIAQVLAAPAVQWLGLGTHSSTFNIFFGLLAAGNALNIIGLSGYYWQLTSGTLAPLVMVQAVMAVINVGLGLLGHAMDSAVVVIAAYAAAFAYGGLVSRSYLPGTSAMSTVKSTVLVGVVAAAASAILYLKPPTSLLASAVLLGCGMAAGVAGFLFAYRTIRRKAT